MSYAGLTFAEIVTNTSGEHVYQSGSFNNVYQMLAKLNVTEAPGDNDPTLDVAIQQSLDNGVTWDPFIEFNQVADATSDETLTEQDADEAAFSGDLKVVWTVGGGLTHGLLVTDPSGANNKQTHTGKSTDPTDDNKTSLTVVAGDPGASIAVAVDGQDITVTLAKAAAIAGSLQTALSGNNNDLKFTARTPGVAGNSIAVVYDNSAVQSVTSVSLTGSTITAFLRTAIVKASLTTALSGANNDLTYTAVSPVAATGNAIHIVYVDPGAAGALSVGVVGSVITVTLASSAAPAITSTASQVLAAIQASTPASALVTVALAAANTGAGVVTALSDTPLTGGDNKSIVATGAEVLAAFAQSADARSLVLAELKSGNDGTGVVTALASTPLASGADAAITSTAANVATAVAASTPANALVGVANFAGNDGSGVMTALPKAFLDNMAGESYTFQITGFAK